MSTVVTFPSQHRPAEAIDADMAAEMARHNAAMRELWAERAGLPARTGGLRADPPAERRMSLGRAAGELGMRERQLRSLLTRYHDTFPDRQRLGTQPAGMKNSPWSVYPDRVRAVIESGEPY